MRHAATSATRVSAFPGDEPLEDRARDAAATLAAGLPRRCEVLSSPALRCRQTAEAAGLQARVDERLRECDFGRWAGRTLADVAPAEGRTWMMDPDAAPHGGESLRGFATRVARWVDDQADASGAAVAITHAGVVKATIVHALGAPLPAFWRIDAAPLGLTELHAHDGRWTVVRVNASLT